MDYLKKMGERAKKAAYALNLLSDENKNHALRAAAEELVKETEKILAANASDVERAEKAGMSPALIDRLKASEFLETSSLKATHNLNLRSSKLLSSSKLYLSQEFATLALKIERRSSHYHDLVASNGLYTVMKSRLGANSQNLYEDMMKLINMA